MGRTSIEWTANSDGTAGKSWNPIRARNKETGKVGHYCQKVSPGCKNCYAESMNCWSGNKVEYSVPGLSQVEIYLDEEELLAPLHWRKPAHIFPCSMTDMYASFVPDRWIDAIHSIYAMCPRHKFMELTKRPQRRLAYLTQLTQNNGSEAWADRISYCKDEEGNFRWHDEAECVIANSINGVLGDGYNVGWPMSNVWRGTSICTQEEMDKHAAAIRATPAAVRWLSIEPILEQITIPIDCMCEAKEVQDFYPPWGHAPMCPARARLHWVVVGGESGQKARHTDISQVRSVMQQCIAGAVHVFVKQLGRKAFQPGDPEKKTLKTYLPIRDPKGGDMAEWPEDLRVRQMPV